MVHGGDDGVIGSGEVLRGPHTALVVSKVSFPQLGGKGSEMR